MTGLEVITAIQLVDACIGIAKTIIDIARAAQDAQGLPPKLRELLDKLPAIEELLENAYENLEQDEKVSDEAQSSAKPILEQCKQALSDLRDIMRKACPKDGDNRSKRMWKGAKTVFFGRDSQVKNLLTTIQDNLKLLEQKEIFVIGDKLDALQELTESLGHDDSGKYEQSGEGFIIANEGGTPTNYVQGGSHNRQIISPGVYNEGPSMHTHNNFFTTGKLRVHYYPGCFAWKPRQRLTVRLEPADEFKKIVNYLSPPDPWTTHASARQRHEPQTGNWLLHHDVYQSWKTGTTRHIWMHGKAGCGKTVLCSTAVEDVRSYCRTQPNTALAVFYFSFSDERKKTYEGLLRSLLAQLGWQEPGLSMLRNMFRRQDGSVPDNLELQKILHASVDSYAEVFLHLDALDESPEENDLRHSLLEWIAWLANSATNIKIFFTSRETRDIYDYMETLGARQILIPGRAVDADIAEYISNETARNSRLRRLSPESQRAIKTTISQKADGMFRWAYCQLQELKTLKSSKPKYIEEALRTLPPTLDATYTRMLAAIAPMFQAEALTLLRWLAYARSPPSLFELAEAAIIDPSASERVDISNRGDLEDTLEILSGLVTVVESDGEGVHDTPDVSGEDSDAEDGQTGRKIDGSTEVRLAHFSVKEYLESTRILESVARMFHLSPEVGHRFIAHSCVSYIIYYSKEPHSERYEYDYALLPYAMRSWHYHSSLHHSKEVSLEVLLLSSEQARQDWLSFESPDGQASYDMSKIKDTGSALYYASLVGLVEVAAALIAQGEPVDARGGMFDNPLQAAAYKGHADIVKLLIDNGASNDPDPGHYDNLFQAIENKGADRTALQAASSAGHADIVKLLLDRGADINVKRGRYGTALCAALCRGHREVAKILLERGADVNLSGTRHGSPMHIAMSARDAEMWQLLIEKNASFASGEMEKLLLDAIEQDDPEMLKALLHPDVEGGLRKYEGALEDALSDGVPGLVQLFVDGAMDSYDSALRKAASEAGEEILELLISSGWIYDKALHEASSRGHADIVKLLIDDGVDIYGNALEVALRELHSGKAKLLLEKRADIRRRALDVAKSNGHEETTKALLNKDTTRGTIQWWCFILLDKSAAYYSRDQLMELKISDVVKKFLSADRSLLEEAGIPSLVKTLLIADTRELKQKMDMFLSLFEPHHSGLRKIVFGERNFTQLLEIFLRKDMAELKRRTVLMLVAVWTCEDKPDDPDENQELYDKILMLYWLWD